MDAAVNKCRDRYKWIRIWQAVNTVKWFALGIDTHISFATEASKKLDDFDYKIIRIIVENRSDFDDAQASDLVKSVIEGGRISNVVDVSEAGEEY